MQESRASRCQTAISPTCPKINRHSPRISASCNWAQQFALHNRNEMMDRVLAEVSVAVHGDGGHEREIEVQRINSHHNFTQMEEHFGERVWITRKGAIEAARTTGR